MEHWEARVMTSPRRNPSDETEHPGAVRARTAAESARLGFAHVRLYRVEVDRIHDDIFIIRSTTPTHALVASGRCAEPLLTRRDALSLSEMDNTSNDVKKGLMMTDERVRSL